MSATFDGALLYTFAVGTACLGCFGKCRCDSHFLVILVTPSVRGENGGSHLRCVCALRDFVHVVGAASRSVDGGGVADAQLSFVSRGFRFA